MKLVPLHRPRPQDGLTGRLGPVLIEVGPHYDHVEDQQNRRGLLLSFGWEHFKYAVGIAVTENMVEVYYGFGSVGFSTAWGEDDFEEIFSRKPPDRIEREEA